MSSPAGTPWSVEGLPDVLTFNYAVHHCGLERWAGVTVRNNGTRPAGPTLLAVDWSELARPHLVAVPALPPGQEAPLGRRLVPLIDHGQLGRLPERREVWWEVRGRGLVVHRSRVRLLPYNEWTWARGREVSLAAFVQPNAAAVTDVAADAKGHLTTRTGCSAFQQALEKGNAEAAAGGPASAWAGMAAALYDFLHDRCRWRYEYEPPSFERDSQKILLPADVWRLRQGTCLDLAVSFASCLERVHLRPLVVVLRQGISQHALAGWWAIAGRKFPDGLLTDKAVLTKLLGDGAADLVECTGFAEGEQGGKPTPKTDFESARKLARDSVASWDLWAAVDVAAAREQLGVTPLPAAAAPEDWEAALRPFFEGHRWPVAPGAAGVGWLGEQGRAVYQQALRDAAAGGTGEWNTRHTLLTLLGVPGGTTERAAERLGADVAWLRGRLLTQVRKNEGARPKPAVPTDAVTQSVRRAYDESFRDHHVPVGDAEILRAVVADEGSRAVQELLTDLRCERPKLLEAVDEASRPPPRKTAPRSGDDFPWP